MFLICSCQVRQFQQCCQGESIHSRYVRDVKEKASLIISEKVVKYEPASYVGRRNC